MGFIQRSNRYYDSTPRVESIARFGVVEGDLLLAVETWVDVKAE